MKTILMILNHIWFALMSMICAMCIVATANGMTSYGGAEPIFAGAAALTGFLAYLSFGGVRRKS